MPVCDHASNRSSSRVSGPAAGLTRAYLLVVVLAMLPVGFLVIDPWILGHVRLLDPNLHRFFADFTDIGKSHWMLIPTGLGAGLLYWGYRRTGARKRAAAYGIAAQMAAFVFATVAGAGLLTSLAKNIIGRARPRHFEALGAVAFEPFAFVAPFASFPSGHATNIFALAGAIMVLWPRTAVPAVVAAAIVAATRVLIGSHYFTDVAVGALVGLVFAHGLRNRLAARRWLFQVRDGTVVVRGRRPRAWTAANLRRSGNARPNGSRAAFL